MVLVNYPHSFNYRQFPSGSFPVLQLRIARQDNHELGIDTDAYLDSGAERSLFNGDLLTGLEIEVINEKPKPYSSASGNIITGYLHEVQLTIPGVGAFNLEIGFTEVRIIRNLLGRDFFNLVQIGFREHQLQYYLNSTP